MKQVDDAPRKPHNDETPSSYDELIHIDKLKRDHLNVRNEDPSPQLINNIREMGFVNALITREDPENEGEYLITDGWQRYQSACEVGFNHIPIDIYKNRNQATKYAGSHSMGKAWDDIADYNQDYIRIKKVFMEMEGLSEQEAIDKRSSERQVTKETVKINYEIAQMPQRVKQLIKEPDDRENGFHDEWMVKGCLNKKHGSLNKENAHFIAKRYLNSDLSETEAFNFGMRATRNSDMSILRKALEKFTYNNLSVKDSFNKAKDDVVTERTKTNFNVGLINLTEEEKKILSTYIHEHYKSTVSKYFNQLVKEEKENMLDEINKEKYLTDQWAIDDSKNKID